MKRAAVKFTREKLPTGQIRMRWSLHHWHPRSAPWRGWVIVSDKHASRMLEAWLTQGAYWLHAGETFK